jgi:AcrR family transcriptional regulator
MPERKSQTSPRRRLPADEARARILEAAERKLSAVGPEGLRLTELAAELGISHPAILHHFGSREELMLEVIRAATRRLNGRLTAAIEGGAEGHAGILDMIAEYYGTEGNARLIAWLVLSGRSARPRPRGPTDRPLLRLIERAHAQRTQTHPEADYDDTKFRGQLTALALLGESIFGDIVRSASGDATGPDAARDFRKRLARLLADTLK